MILDGRRDSWEIFLLHCCRVISPLKVKLVSSRLELWCRYTKESISILIWVADNNRGILGPGSPRSVILPVETVGHRDKIYPWSHWKLCVPCEISHLLFERNRMSVGSRDESWSRIILSNRPFILSDTSFRYINDLSCLYFIEKYSDSSRGWCNNL